MKIALVGYGKMGQALLSGWLKQQSVTHCAIIDPYAEKNPPNTSLYKLPKNLPSDFKPDCVVFAIKPQVMVDIVPAYKKLVYEDCFFLSIAAGKTIGFLENKLGKDAKIIRAMPNTPAAIGKGITVATGNSNVIDENKSTALDLLKAVGDAIWSDDESIMDAVTAVSGSGPAYVFLLIECMTNAGIKAGLPKDLAEKLARQTVIGSASLAENEKDTTAEKLRENVTSPNGTTAAALDILMNEATGLQQLIDTAINAATIRGKELS